MEEIFGTLSLLGIAFQEAVLASCDEYGYDPNNLTESDWNDLYAQLTEESFNELVVAAVGMVSGK